jgi:two-component system cell cycle response regulator
MRKHILNQCRPSLAASETQAGEGRMPGTILIVDDVATNRILLKSRLAEACYGVAQAATGAEGVAAARRLRLDLALIDAALPDLDGPGVVARLRADPATAMLPVLVRCAPGDRRGRIAALAAGADGVFDRDDDDRVLLARIRSLLRDGAPLAEAAGAEGMAEPARPFETPARIALVADRPETALHWRSILAPHCTGRLAPMTPAAALAATDAPPDVYVIGAGGGGLELLSDLRARAGSREAAFCVILPAPAPATMAMALDLGAGDVMADGFDPAEGALRLRILVARKRAADAARAAVRAGLAAAAVDPLTGLWNRRHAMPAFARMTAAADAGSTRCAVMLIDIDRFKAVNDGHGHAAGDAVLCAVAGQLRRLAGADALVARIGGEEFLVALPAATVAAARDAADRLRRGVAALRPTMPDGTVRSVTVSIGVTLATPGADPAALLADADRALLAAKAEGRNQVTLCPCAA